MEARTLQPSRRTRQVAAFAIAYAATLLLVAALFHSILKLNHGTFTYTLDDPYIDLALGDQIRHGNYGIQPGHHAAPSSSILYPLLLVPGANSRLFIYLPLLLNVIGLLVAMDIMRSYFRHLRLAQDNFAVIVQAAAIVMMAVCFNLVGVVFTGLEHNLHIAAMAGIIYGLALFLDTDQIPRWLPALIVLAPLLRFESLPLCLAAVLVFALRGRWRTAAGTFAATILLLAGYSIFLVKLGLPPLPSSVLVKSTMSAQALGTSGIGMLKAFAGNAILMSAHNTGIVLLLLGIAAAARCAVEIMARPARWSSQGLMAFVLFCIIAGHAVAGRFGWFERYEDYLLVSASLLGIYVIQQPIRTVLADPAKRLVFVPAAALVLLVVGARYCRATAQVPLAANNIYQQQFQMQRFVNDFYKGPVAVNDVGLVSFRNPYDVLDLYGLTSEAARKLLWTNANADAYRDLVLSHEVHFAMLYGELFGKKIPVQWTKVASLKLSRPKVSVADNTVDFYATDPATAIQLRQQLTAFQPTLPPGVSLTIN